jgi:hypothetical protein
VLDLSQAFVNFVGKRIDGLLPTLLPDPDTILRLQMEFVADRDLVDFIPAIDIAHCIASIFSRRVCIGLELLTQRSFGLETWQETVYSRGRAPEAHPGPSRCLHQQTNCSDQDADHFLGGSTVSRSWHGQGGTGSSGDLQEFAANHVRFQHALPCMDYS